MKGSHGISSHVSVLSHPPSAARQTVVAGLKGLEGHAGAEPLQKAGSSQGPVALLHWVVAGLKGLAGHARFVPSHNAGRSAVA